MEYICPYGHGKLNVQELQISGKVAPAWTEHGDMWDELFASHSRDRRTNVTAGLPQQKLPAWRLAAAVTDPGRHSAVVGSLHPFT